MCKSTDLGELNECCSLSSAAGGSSSYTITFLAGEHKHFHTYSVGLFFSVIMPHLSQKNSKVLYTETWKILCVLAHCCCMTKGKLSLYFWYNVLLFGYVFHKLNGCCMVFMAQ